MIRNREELATTEARELALGCLESGLEASDPVHVLQDAVSLDGSTLAIGESTYDLDAYERVLVVGGGKATGDQASALEKILGDRIDGGAIVTVEPVELADIDVHIGDHPVPSERGIEGTRAILDLLDGADDRTLVLGLITGGGSALLPAPADNVTLEDLQNVTEALLASGASIHEINAVRKHLSSIKGGGLARAASPATVVGLLMSDVVGDDLSVIASGPTVPDESTYDHAIGVLERYDIDPPKPVVHRLQAGARGELPETPTSSDAIFDRVTNHLTADGTTAVRAAKEHLASTRYNGLFLSSRIRGEAREAATSHIAIAEEIQATGHPVEPPAVVLSAGETTVTVRGDGDGGPNQEFALSAAIEQVPGVTLASIDTDGIDGASPAAGGLIDAGTVDDVDRARDALGANDAYPYLTAQNGAVETGPTGTNVNDFRVMVVEKPGSDI